MEISDKELQYLIDNQVTDYWVKTQANVIEDDKVHNALTELQQLRKENQKLKQFVRKGIGEICWEMADSETEDMALKLGILDAYVVTQEDHDKEHFEDFEVGQSIFVFADWMDLPEVE